MHVCSNNEEKAVILRGVARNELREGASHDLEGENGRWKVMSYYFN